MTLGDEIFGDEEINQVKYEAIKPDTPPDTQLSPAYAGPYPPLPSQVRGTSSVLSDIASTLGNMSIGGNSETSTVVNSPVLSPVTATFPQPSFRGGSVHPVPSTHGSTIASSSRQPKVWGSRDGKSTTDVLFPGSKPTPASEEFSIAAHDERMEQEQGLNIMRTRFWDPLSSDFNPDRFWDPILNKYSCPFVCE
jgi:hypothetical protein